MSLHREGMAIGLSQWPEAKYALGPVNATMQPTIPKSLPALLAKARTAGLRVLCVFPRPRVTENGQTNGVYSVAKAQALAKEYVKYLTTAQLASYVASSTLLGFSAGDDFSNAESWGGQAVTPGQAYEVIAYAKGVLGPTVPVGLRQTPAWISGSAPLARTIDFGWLQWLAKRGDPQVFYDKGWKIASNLGFNLAGGVNSHSCVEAGADDPCSPDTLWRVGCIAEDHPGIRAFISWRYDPEDMKVQGPTWAKLADRAALRPNRSLLRGAA